VAEAERGEGYCLPDDYISPLPIPDPVGDPPAPGGEVECDLQHATWNPAPANPGITITQWGGGNVDEFPLVLATSYWTTVDGELVGYIPGAPEWVNSAFLAQ